MGLECDDLPEHLRQLLHAKNPISTTVLGIRDGAGELNRGSEAPSSVRVTNRGVVLVLMPDGRALAAVGRDDRIR